MRAAVAAQIEGVFEKYVEAAFHHMWVEPKKMDDPDVAAKALASSGLDAAKLLARSQDADVKAKLIENTQNAVERGAFGSPTFFVGRRCFRQGGFVKSGNGSGEGQWRVIASYSLFLPYSPPIRHSPIHLSGGSKEFPCVFSWSAPARSAAISAAGCLRLAT
jgi:hypothetical protein